MAKAKKAAPAPNKRRVAADELGAILALALPDQAVALKRICRELA